MATDLANGENGGIFRAAKKLLLGRPLRTAQAQHERLSNPVALAVFASDAVSSTAYATEEILLILTLAGAAAAADVLPIAIGIIGLIVIVAISYRQTIHAYPGGGGAYIVAKENLGQMAGLIAGAALLIDYVLTAAVSVASGIAAFTSAVPAFSDQRVLLCLLIVLFIALANLRGARESGA
ncbi:MAG: amino acid permease, partial [bacterium]